MKVKFLLKWVNIDTNTCIYALVILHFPSRDSENLFYICSSITSSFCVFFFLPACHSDQDNFKFNHSHNNVFQNDFHAKSKSNCTDVQMLNPLGSETWTMSQEIAFADLQSVCIKGSLCHSIMLLLSSQIAIHQPEIVWL